MEVTAKSIHHLGVVSGICDEIELEKTINSIIPTKMNTKLSMGTRVKAMVINGLGFTGRPLYLTEQFFENKALNLLLGKEIESTDLNDDSLGRALDAISDAGPEFLFSAIASRAVKLYKVQTKKLHLDTTSYSVDGQYEEGIGLMQFGHSKDLRKDLKQMILSSFTTTDGAIPLMVKVLPGNTSDSKHFKEALHALKDNVLASQKDFMVVFDCAGYNAEIIANLNGLFWVSRVPDTINACRELKENTQEENFIDIGNGYSACETTSDYAGVRQRWILIKSQKAFEREKKTATRAVKKEEEKLIANIKRLNKKNTACKTDAENAFNDLVANLKYHKITSSELVEKKKYAKKGKPKANSDFTIVYQINATFIPDEDKIKKIIASKGQFIIATNCLDKETFSSAEALKTYKDQHKVEGNFRFLKNPVCMASSVYLKNEKRIIALAIVMFICLLIYAVAERALRIALIEDNETVLSQNKKPVQNPTMKWIFQKMEDIILVSYIEENELVTTIKNLTPELIKIITLLGKLCMARYLIPLKGPS
jgi:transposase